MVRSRPISPTIVPGPLVALPPGTLLGQIPARTAGIRRAVERPPPAWLRLRRLDDRVRVHAERRTRRRPPARLLPVSRLTERQRPERRGRWAGRPRYGIGDGRDERAPHVRVAGRRLGVEDGPEHRAPETVFVPRLPCSVTLIEPARHADVREVEAVDRADVRPGIGAEDRRQLVERVARPSATSSRGAPVVVRRAVGGPVGGAPQVGDGSRDDRAGGAREHVLVVLGGPAPVEWNSVLAILVPLRHDLPGGGRDRRGRRRLLAERAAVDLGPGVVVEVPLTGPGVEPVAGVAPGGDRLGLERLDRPARRHLGRDDTAQVEVELGLVDRVDPGLRRAQPDHAPIAVVGARLREDLDPRAGRRPRPGPGRCPSSGGRAGGRRPCCGRRVGSRHRLGHPELGVGREDPVDPVDRPRSAPTVQPQRLRGDGLNAWRTRIRTGRFGSVVPSVVPG